MTSDAHDPSAILRGFLSPADAQRLVDLGTAMTLPAGAELIREGDLGRDLYLLLDGEVALSREGTVLKSFTRGMPLGVLGLLTGRPRTATLSARTPLQLSHLSVERWLALTQADPPYALRVAIALANSLRDELMEMTGAVGRLSQGRSLPRSPTVTVTLDGAPRTVPTATLLSELLPKEKDGALVVAGLLEQKPVSLGTPVLHDGEVRALTMRDWEGRRVFAHTLGLLLLEAAREVVPEVSVRMGASQGPAQLVDTPGLAYEQRARLAGRLQETMERLAASKLPVRMEHWPVEEAQDFLEKRGWKDAASLLHSHRQPTVSLCNLGQTWALAFSPLMSTVEACTGFRVSATAEGLLLHYGLRDPRHDASQELGPVRGQDMAKDHREWLHGMGVASVGEFSKRCVDGQVAQLIRVSEGFHEKAIGRLADLIARRKDKVRVIAVAGPSSSGKTTFLKRLTVQLQINGLNPVSLSLDDYYVDREKTVRDEKGEYDFEALEALDLGHLQAHVERLLAGEEVLTARYDFKTGKSHPGGGHALRLRPGDVLMVEGIHGLNPRLLGRAVKEGELFRVFIHPATTLAFDRLSRASATDLRLLRRIVRDRHGRGYKAHENIQRWPSVQAGEQKHIFPFQSEADAIFDTSLIYEPSVLKVYAERYLLEVPRTHPAYPTAWRLRQLVDKFVAIYPEHVPPTSILREFIGGSGFEY